MHYSFNQAETACFTGHRNIPESDRPQLAKRIQISIRALYKAGYKVFLCGGARGFDTMAATEVLSFRAVHPDVRLVIAVPCASQADRWSKEERDTYQKTLKLADQVIILSDFYYSGCMQARNRFMVDHSSACICCLTHFKGGTWSTVRYALHCNVRIWNLAMPDGFEPVLRENQWSCIFTFRFVPKNVSIVHLSPFPLKKVKRKNISGLCCRKRT